MEEPTESDDVEEISRSIAHLISEKKAEDVAILEVREVLPVCDFFVIGTGRNEQHLTSLSDHIQEKMKEWGQEEPAGIEGYEEGLWVLMDYGTIVVHLFQEHVREYYRMESLWADAPITHYDSAEN